MESIKMLETAVLSIMTTYGVIALIFLGINTKTILAFSIDLVVLALYFTITKLIDKKYNNK